MNLARALIEKPLIAWTIALVSLIGGIIAYIDIGRLEDPKFTIKTAVVVTLYPGASARQVESEVTDRMESAVQQLEQVDFIRSRSMAGYSEVRVQIRDQYASKVLQQVWEQLRRQVNDVTPHLPPGAGPPIVFDRFGDVYGMFYAITGKGYSQSQLFDYARDLRKELLTIPDVADIVIAGNQQEQVTITADQSLLVANNLSSDDIAQALGVQNEIRSAGRERVGDQLMRLSPTGTLDTLAAVRALPIGTTPGELQLGDVARVHFGYASVPTQAIRYNGQDALTIGISARSGVNVVKVGEEVKAKMQALERARPLGIELHVLYDQPEAVDAAVRGFVFDVMLSVGIVTVALGIGLGWRAGVVLGIELFLSILGTLFVMYAAGIELQRISLGALIIVMGMLTDNSIVVCEGMLVRVQRGLSHVEAAAQVLKQGQWLLLASTVVGILAFSGIGMSPDAVGEFCASLFAVAAISLLLSWVIAIALTPLLGYYFFRKAQGEQKDPFDAPLYRRYGRLLGWVERRRVWVIASMVVLFAVCVWGFRFVEQSFFPASTNPIFYVDMRLPRGADIRTVMERTKGPEKLLLAQPGVVNVGTYIGGGATRFILVYDPETQDPSYAQFIVTVDDASRIDGMIPKLDTELRKRFPDVSWSVTRPNFGPSSGLPIQARFLGPDPAVLRSLGAQAEAVLHRDAGLQSIRNDWENPVNVVRPVFDDTRARALGVTRRQLNDTLAYATEGLRVGIFRDNDLLLPIVLNEPSSESGIERVAGLQIFSLGQRRYVPVADVLTGITYGTEDGLISRRDRIRTLTVSAGTRYGENSVAAFDRIRAPVEAIRLPPGYRLEWGGEYESSNKAKESLFRQLPIGFAGMLLLVLFMFGRLKPALIVLLVVPMSICGVTIGLLLFRGAFGFMSLLGLLSLIGMLIKNGVVLVDEIDLQIASGVPRMRAVIDGSKSRLRPVALAAGTTILGMVPLLWDPFFKDMAITMMAGLAFATVLTMAAVPALYVQFFSIRSDEIAPRNSNGAHGAHHETR
ncbi:multidrug efflux pump subunit AcrB [Paraburkholderia silvatlantica]|uniref:Multidrug efflux pump subunit AcrB n=1 Tax=Paraburkholderia silvatlantica TaxID=321895 RepID=A0A2V4TR12_9BURK|nr:efflux RND transporter permease subunit [Paraburkholderia silvatlantica]PYE27855.1 multidrug efflux pump subunit AcrB [Paraburkholderia silvatlantica]